MGEEQQQEQREQPNERRVRFALNGDGSVQTSVLNLSASVPVPGTGTNMEILYNQPSPTRLLDILSSSELPFVRQGRRSFQLVQGDRVIRVFDGGLDEILRFMLQHGIPEAEKLDKASREELVKAVAFVRVPRKDLFDAHKGLCGFRTSDAKVLPDRKILSVLKNCGFVFCDHSGNQLTPAQERTKFVRILSPGGTHVFHSLAEVRVHCRHSRLRLGNKAANHLEQRIQMLALRLWGATTAAPLPTFHWDRFLEEPERKPVPSELLGQEMSAAPKSILKTTSSFPRFGLTTHRAPASPPSASSSSSRKPFVETSRLLPGTVKVRQRFVQRGKEKHRSRQQKQLQPDHDNVYFERFYASKKQNTNKTNTTTASGEQRAVALNDENAYGGRSEGLWRSCSSYRH